MLAPAIQRRGVRLMRTSRRFGTAAVASIALTATIAGGALAQEDVEGSVVISGSSTVEPISSFVAEAFAPVYPNVTVSVDGPGTTTGFELFCNGETDIADASRPIRDTEIETCSTNGVTPVELKVGIDGLSVVVSTQNDTIECLNFNDLYAIFGVESDEIATWEDAAAFAAELGSSTTAWPTGDLSITAPGDESGTHGSFIEIALEGIQEARAEGGSEAAAADPNTRQPGSIYTASPNDNVIIDGVSGNPNAIGFVGFAYAVNNPDRVRMVPIDAGDGTCVAPDHDSVAANTYPISRDLFIYTAAERIAEGSDVYNPVVVPFVDYYLSDVGIQNVTAAGYVELAPDALETTRAAWEAAKGMG
jgi:phosphate transport system substrate-binding protein